jgi:flagellar hook assembly protein FlgD
VLEGQLRFDGIDLAYAPGNLSSVTAINVDHLQLIGRTVTGVATDAGTIPDRFVLHQNSPNPFNPSTQLAYNLSAEANVSLTIYDLLGREIAQLVDRHEAAGYHTATWTPDQRSGGASGMYIARLRVTGDRGTVLYTGSVKLLMVK